jgi:peptide/nickel transport system permease protein
MGYLPGKILSFFFTMWLVSLITFAVFQIIPGNPALIILGAEAEPEQVVALERELGLDQPLSKRYLSWLKGLCRGDLGNSLRFSQPVKNLLVSSLKVTLPMAGMALVIVIFLGIPLGIYTGRYNQQKRGFIPATLVRLGIAMPSFWLGILLMLAFARLIKCFTPGAFVPWEENWAKALFSLFPPALAVALPRVAILARYVRTAFLEEKEADYIRTAYAKGLKNKTVLYKHLLKNILISITTIIGLILTDVLGGSIIIENVFAIPGVGRLLVSAISYRDFPLLQGIALYLAGVVVFINFIVDFLYCIIDPRIRIS